MMRFKSLGGSDPRELFAGIKTPAYVIDEGALIRNGEILKDVADRSGAKILLAQKAFSNYKLYPLLENYLAGTEASGLYEARLGREEMPQKEVHVFCAAFSESDLEETLRYADHIVFNSINQLEKYAAKAREAGVSTGLRINPEKSTQEGHEIYDPCSPESRLGVKISELNGFDRWDLVDGIHFHTLCEQDSDDLKTTLDAVKEKFGHILKKPENKWLNMGGGHHIPREDYNRDLLIELVKEVSSEYKVQVYLEPGEAVALNAGYLVSRVLDIKEENVILDTSAACHMPDVLEMPYTPDIYGASTKTGKIRYRLGGPTCLAGDRIGEYFFDKELKEGDILVFGDMAIYTTVKNNTFNGMPLPDILLRKTDGSMETLNSFGYGDFRSRL